ncbi:NAD(+)/NADH kinase [Chloroflexota bacterium]
MTTYRADATLPCPMNRVGVLHRPHVKRARELAEKLQALLVDRGIATWLGSAWDDDAARNAMEGTDLIVGIGGDGSLLHCARVSAQFGTPVLGVKLGQLGFITEVGEDGALEALGRVLDGEGWIEERTMLQARVGNDTYLGLNDAVVRCTAVRLIAVECEVDGAPVTTYRADGVIVATATGSTGYSLAAGGPVLLPEADGMVVQPISSHLGLSHSLVLPRSVTISLRVNGRDGVVLSIDGQIDRPLSSGEQVLVSTSEYRARFLRLRPNNYFYQSLHQKLGGNGT